MTRLAYRDSGRRRRGGGGSGPRRPFLFREVRRCDSEFLLREGFCHPRHDLVVSISTLEVTQLFQEVTLRLTPDDWNGCIRAHAVHAVAFVANAQLRAEFSIRARIRDCLSGNCRRGKNDQNAADNLWTQELSLSRGLLPANCSPQKPAAPSGRSWLLPSAQSCFLRPSFASAQIPLAGRRVPAVRVLPEEPNPPARYCMRGPMI